MDDALGMRERERVCDGGRSGHGLAERQAASLHPRREGLAVDPLHDERRFAVRQLAFAQVADDGRVIESSEHANFTTEPQQVANQPAAKHFDRDHLAGRAIAGAEHGPHSAATDLALELVASRDVNGHCEN